MVRAVIVLTLAGIPLQGCAVLVGAAAGGAMGYALAYNGYEVQSPITRGGATNTPDSHPQGR